MLFCKHLVLGIYPGTKRLPIWRKVRRFLTLLLVKKEEKMKREMYVTPKMEVERFEEEVVITVVSNGISTETDDVSEKTDISNAGNSIGW